MSQSLVNQREFPAISIILPTHPQYPDYKLDKEHMLGIIANVENQLSKQYSKKKTQFILGKLNAVINRVDFSKLSQGLAIYVSPNIEKIIHLPFLVSSEKVIVDESFEIRDLIYAVKTSRNCLLVVITQNNVKTFLSTENSLLKINFADMPENVKDVINEHSLPGWDYLDSKAWDEKNIHNYLRFIDKTIEKELRNITDNVIIMGDKKLLGYIKKHTRIKNKIIGFIEGNYDYHSESELLKLIQPNLEKENLKEEEYAMKLLEEAINNGNYSAGITEVWRAALEGRGRLLIVEKDYKQPARMSNDRYTILINEENNNPWNIISDAVDDTLEQIIKNKGDILFVDNGKLNKYQKIVLVNRY